MESLQIQVFQTTECNDIRDRLLQIPQDEWIDGKLTTGDHAKTAKVNTQLKPTNPLNNELIQLTRNRLRKNPAFKSFCIPKTLHHNIISKTNAGGGYGTHIDNAFMKTGRADISYTICFSEEEDYQGGELEIYEATQSTTIKIKQGYAYIYPSNQLHQVKTVTAGTRLACAGWVQSYISCHDLRMNLFNLEAGANYLLAEQGRSDALDRIFLAHANLLRNFGN
ncbi:MAG: Fe2+-dependent dioxygenase [Synechococcus sp.]